MLNRALYLALKLVIFTSSVRLCSSWICSGLLGGTCDSAQGEERCFNLYENQYVKPLTTKVYYTDQHLICYLKCHLEACSCAIYFPDKRCMLMFAGDFSKSPVKKFFLMGKNVAKNKPVTASSRTTSSGFQASLAVNGDTDWFHYTDVADTNAWLQVDLLTPRTIKGIRVISRPDLLRIERFINIEILVGNSPVTNDDFSSHVLVHKIETELPGVGYWFNVRVDVPGAYRYVVLRKYHPVSDENNNFLEVAELEVLL